MYFARFNEVIIKPKFLFQANLSTIETSGGGRGELGAPSAADCFMVIHYTADI